MTWLSARPKAVACKPHRPFLVKIRDKGEYPHRIAEKRYIWYNMHVLLHKRAKHMASNRSEFIKEHSDLFWYTPEQAKQSISDDLLVETTLNYGTLDDFRELRRIMTPKRLAKVFFSATGRKAGNYYPEIRNFFSLVLRSYA